MLSVLFLSYSSAMRMRIFYAAGCIRTVLLSRPAQEFEWVKLELPSNLGLSISTGEDFLFYIFFYYFITITVYVLL